MSRDFCITTSAIWRLVGYAIFVIKIAVPIIIIVLGTIDLVKCVTSGKDEEIKSSFQKLLKKVIIGILIFLVPTITRTVFKLIKEASESMKYAETCIICLTGPTSKTCGTAVTTAAEYRKTRNEELYNKYYEGLNGDKDEPVVIGGKSGGDPAPENPDNPENPDTPKPIPDNPDNVECSESYKNSNLTVEPNPLRVIACYPEQYKVSDFVNMGNLGAWPANYNSIPKNIGSCPGRLLFPVNGNYGIQSSPGGYQHGGLDVGWIIGTPVYAPASGSAKFAWGEARGNSHGGESNYSVSIFLSNPKTVRVDGKNFTITAFWIGHMLGVVSRSDKVVNQGELIGYRGTAHFSNGVASLGPHIHWGFQGKWEGETNYVFLNDDQTTRAFSILYSNINNSVKAGMCF